MEFRCRAFLLVVLFAVSASSRRHVHNGALRQQRGARHGAGSDSPEHSSNTAAALDRGALTETSGTKLGNSTLFGDGLLDRLKANANQTGNSALGILKTTETFKMKAESKQTSTQTKTQSSTNVIASGKDVLNWEARQKKNVNLWWWNFNENCVACFRNQGTHWYKPHQSVGNGACKSDRGLCLQDEATLSPECRNERAKGLVTTKENCSQTSRVPDDAILDDTMCESNGLKTSPGLADWCGCANSTQGKRTAVKTKQACEANDRASKCFFDEEAPVCLPRPEQVTAEMCQKHKTDADKSTPDGLRIWCACKQGKLIEEKVCKDENHKKRTVLCMWGNGVIKPPGDSSMCFPRPGVGPSTNSEELQGFRWYTALVTDMKRKMARVHAYTTAMTALTTGVGENVVATVESVKFLRSARQRMKALNDGNNKDGDAVTKSQMVSTEIKHEYDDLQLKYNMLLSVHLQVKGAFDIAKKSLAELEIAWRPLATNVHAKLLEMNLCTEKLADLLEKSNDDFAGILRKAKRWPKKVCKEAAPVNFDLPSLTALPPLFIAEAGEISVLQTTVKSTLTTNLSPELVQPLGGPAGFRSTLGHTWEADSQEVGKHRLALLKEAFRMGLHGGGGPAAQQAALSFLEETSNSSTTRTLTGCDDAEDAPIGSFVWCQCHKMGTQGQFTLVETAKTCIEGDDRLQHCKSEPRKGANESVINCIPVRALDASKEQNGFGPSKILNKTVEDALGNVTANITVRETSEKLSYEPDDKMKEWMNGQVAKAQERLKGVGQGYVGLQGSSADLQGQGLEAANSDNFFKKSSLSWITNLSDRVLGSSPENGWATDINNALTEKVTAGVRMSEKDKTDMQHKLGHTKDMVQGMEESCNRLKWISRAMEEATLYQMWARAELQRKLVLNTTETTVEKRAEATLTNDVEMEKGDANALEKKLLAMWASISQISKYTEVVVGEVKKILSGGTTALTSFETHRQTYELERSTIMDYGLNTTLANITSQCPEGMLNTDYANKEKQSVEEYMTGVRNRKSEESLKLNAHDKSCDEEFKTYWEDSAGDTTKLVNLMTQARTELNGVLEAVGKAASVPGYTL